MTVTVNGTPIPVLPSMIVEIQVSDAGETMPQVQVNVHGGKLDVYRSHVSYTGNVSIHLFGEEV